MTTSLTLIIAALLTGALTFTATPAAATPGQDADAQQVAERASRKEKAEKVASQWFTALFGGDAEATEKLSALPFAWDRKQILETTKALRDKLASVTEDKGARRLPPFTVELVSDTREIVDQCVPADRLLVTIMIGDEGMALCVRPGDDYKVVGFSD